MSDKTITHVEDGRASRGKAKSTPLLYVALDCEHLAAMSARHALAGVDEVVIGRADERSAERRQDGGVRRLTVGLPDHWLSSTHARLSRVLGQWMLEDADSKNGTFVNGVRVARVSLRDGDLIEAGHVFFVFRSGEELPHDQPADVTASLLRSTSVGLVSLVPRFADSLARLARVAQSDVFVMVRGESGTGKELVARELHRLSGRAGPFVAVNCGALPAALVESELFGHKRGAFSGAIDERPGLVRTAHRGTLFLDEIGDLPIAAQPALLRVLQEREVLPVGATQPVRLDARVVCATHRDLDELVSAGKFRADLLARLSGITLELPPLRDRREEIGMIAGDLLSRLAPNRPAPCVTLEAGRALMFHQWPLNVRELEKCLGAAAVLAGDDPIALDHLSAAVQQALHVAHDSRGESEDPSARQGQHRPLSAREETHRDELAKLFREHAGNVSAVARTLGKARVQVQRWIKRYGLDPGSFRS